MLEIVYNGNVKKTIELIIKSLIIIMTLRWRFYSKPVGLDLESINAVGDGNNRYLRPFLFF